MSTTLVFAHFASQLLRLHSSRALQPSPPGAVLSHRAAILNAFAAPRSIRARRKQAPAQIATHRRRAAPLDLRAKNQATVQ